MTVEIPIHPDFIYKKVDIQELKINYIKRLKAIGANKSTLNLNREFAAMVDEKGAMNCHAG